MEYKIRTMPRHEKIRERASKIPGIDAEEILTFLLLLSVSNELLMSIQERMAHYGLSDGRMAIMMSLRDAPDHAMTPSELAEQIDVTRGTITGLLDGLEKSGWVVRKTHPQDRRMLIVQLTDRGLHILDTLVPEHCKRISEFMKRAELSKEEQQQLVTLLNKVSNGIAAFKEAS